MSNEEAEVGIAEILEACDLLTDRLELYNEQRVTEAPKAEGDERYAFRIRRGIDWSQEIIDMMDDVVERVGALRHNHNQLKWAREGKIV